MVLCSGVVKIFLAVYQVIIENIGNIFKSPYQTAIGLSKANSDIKTNINDVIVE